MSDTNGKQDFGRVLREANTGDLFDRTLAVISPVDEEARRRADEAWRGVAKPLGGLGLLEEDVCALAAAIGTEKVSIAKRRVAVFCADNGVVAEGVSQSGPEVTTAVMGNLCEHVTSVCRMGAVAGCDVVPVDVGVLEGLERENLIVRKCANGTGNIAQGPAMTREQALFAVETGMALAQRWAEEGVDLLIAGEMGIGNTTTSSAVACVLLDADPEFMTGRGAGLSSEGLARKVAVVRRAIELNAPDAGDPVDVLAKVGGFDIAAMCGFYLGAAAAKRPAVLDGFISCVAALCAVRLCPAASGYLLASHCSAEPAAKTVLDALGKQAPICAGMHLGEGTGAVALVPLLDLTLEVYRTGKSFAESGIEAYVDLK